MLGIETPGLVAGEDEIIKVAAYRIEKEVATGKFSKLVNPSKS